MECAQAIVARTMVRRIDDRILSMQANVCQRHGLLNSLVKAELGRGESAVSGAGRVGSCRCCNARLLKLNKARQVWETESSEADCKSQERRVEARELAAWEVGKS